MSAHHFSWIVIAFLAALLIAVVLAVRAELRDAPAASGVTDAGTPYRSGEAPESAPREGRRSRRLARTLLIALLCAPLSTAWLFGTSHQTLSVEPPMSPVPGCDANPGTSDTPVTLIVFLIAFVAGYLLLRLGPALVFAWRERRSVVEGGVPTGDRVLWVALVATAVAMLGAAARLTLSTSYDEEAFTVYGAITPDHAGGQAIDRTIARVIAPGAALAPLGHGADVAEDVEHLRGNDMGFPDSTVFRRGIHAWVGTSPVLIDSDARGDPQIHAVLLRTSDFPERGRPHFMREPLWASAGAGRTVLVEHRDDGTTFAMHFNVDGTFATSLATVGTIVRPPLWPLVSTGIAATLAGWVLLRRRRGAARVAVAWAIIECLILWAIVWSPYLPI